MRRIADDFELDAVVVVEVEPSSWLVVAVVVGFVASFDDSPLGFVEIVDDEAKVIEVTKSGAGRGSRWRGWRGVDRQVVVACSGLPDVDRVAAEQRGALPSDGPTEQLDEHGCGGVGVGDRDVHMLEFRREY